MNKKLVFRWNDTMESFVFTELDRAIRIDKIHRAIFKSKTWDELKNSVHPDDYKFILELYLDSTGNDDDPDLTEKIDWEFFDTDLYGQGIFPSFLIYEMGDIIPPDILKQYGSKEKLTDMGAYQQIKPENLIPMITALTAHGFDVSPSGELVFDDFI